GDARADQRNERRAVVDERPDRPDHERDPQERPDDAACRPGAEPRVTRRPFERRLGCPYLRRELLLERARHLVHRVAQGSPLAPTLVRRRIGLIINTGRRRATVPPRLRRCEAQSWPNPRPKREREVTQWPCPTASEWSI